MKIDITSMFFNSSVNGTATAAWRTSIGQNKSKECRIEVDVLGVTDIVVGILHLLKKDFAEKTHMARGGNNDELLISSVFEKVFINGIQLDCKYILSVVREHTSSHDGRKELCYSPNLCYGDIANAEAIGKMASALGCTEDGCWFVHDISVKNQDELHFSAIIVDPESPANYDCGGAERSNIWNMMVAEQTGDITSYFPLQKIYYGAPGTGKSYKIKNEIIPDGVKPYRVTFYPDYYYSDFVGGLRPRKGADGSIDYEFEPGPFARALCEALMNPYPVYVVIEEINRGNAAAIFGDLFQLLDRKNGISEYTITNKDLYDYLTKEGVAGLEHNKVYLPANLNILCTMNTADQNVFVLDTAFKRRFKMEYVPINFKAYFVDNNEANGVKDECKGYLENVDVFIYDGYEAELRAVMGDELFAAIKKVVKEPKRDWLTFASMVNAKIDQINKEEQKISEDKKLGPFFVDVDELKSRKAFADKVLYYLKQDVFKYEDNLLDDSYEKLYDDFVNKMVDIFKIFQPVR